MNKRLFLLVLVAALLTGGSAMGQTRRGVSNSRKAKIEQKRKRPSVKSSKKTVEVTEEVLVPGEDEIKTKDELKETETAFGQENNDNGTDDRTISRTYKEEVIIEKKTEKPPKADSDQVFFSVEQMPQFPGGEAALIKYLQTHINYPPMAAENDIQGKVIVQFVVKKDGSIGQVKVVRSVDKDLDKEAVRVVKSFPKFNPGRQNGQAVNVWYTLPVTFKLSGSNKADPVQ